MKKTTKIAGKFVGNEKGFGFVLREVGEDIFIPPGFLFGALHGDEVVCKITKEETAEGKSTGEIIEITRRNSMVGTFFLENGVAFVRAGVRKIPYPFDVPPKTVQRFGLADGHRVVFSVDKRLRPEDGPVACFITEVLGHINDPGVDVLSLVRMAEVPYEFPEDVLREMQDIPTQLVSDTNQLSSRRDLRGEYIFTIDGDDTKDIDDAISFAKTADGYTLGVHIADVSHYVHEGTALDKSAFARGTSIYLADRVIPMLPHGLSSGICSLFPDVDRLTLTCKMLIDEAGNVVAHEIFPSIIRSKRRFTYTEAQRLLDADENELLAQMDELRGILRGKRQKRGALDFDFPESKIRVDENGRVVSLEAYPRSNATGIIEEFMILCNETVATHFLKVPFVFRSHDAPTKDKLGALGTMMATFGIKKRVTAKSLQDLLESVKQTPAAFAISTAILRSLPQAAYTSDNPAHYGLASEAYCHFTSPIRRYADLQVHRIVKGARPQDLSAVCAQCSRTERIADILERDVTELKKVQFMADKKGNSFAATVSGVAQWGVYVMLENTAEGLLPSSNLIRHKYRYNAEYGVFERKRRKGEKTGSILRPGSPLQVRLTGADEHERRLSFVLD